MGKKIMIVDDAMFMRKVIRKILESNGYMDISEAENGEQAVELYKSVKPDLVLMDITMPKMSGIEALEKIVETDPGAMVIICSAIGQDMMIHKAICLGARDFIVKPFKEDEFLRILQSVCGE